MLSIYQWCYSKRSSNNMALGLGVFACMTVCLFMALPIRADFQGRCRSFTPEEYVLNSTREVLEYIPAGTNLTFLYNDPSCNRPSQVIAADICRVALSIPTSNRSSIAFEIWLPIQWSGRFLGTGNGGIDGCSYCSSKRDA